MNYSVYAIYSKKLDIIYIGQTSNLEHRLQEHQRGYSKFTSRADDWALIYSEEAQSRGEAMKRERQLKSAGGRRFLRNLITKNS
jgi:putative endonuclease